MGVSIREYARHRGVAESTVRKALRSGRIAAGPDGAIEPETADAAWTANTNAAKRRTRKAVPKAALAAARETLTESGRRPAGAGMTFMEARTASEVLKVQTARINLQRLKGGGHRPGPGHRACLPVRTRGARCVAQLAGTGLGVDGG